RRPFELNYRSQLAGFHKLEDLPFFLQEIRGADYRHERLLAPTEDLLRGYQKKKLTWAEYETEFLSLITERRIEERLDRRIFNVPAVLLCSETTAVRCHRRLVLEY